MTSSDSFFGPWSMEAHSNPWEEYKIGKIEYWYEKSAQLYKSVETQNGTIIPDPIMQSPSNRIRGEQAEDKINESLNSTKFASPKKSKIPTNSINSNAISTNGQNNSLNNINTNSSNNNAENLKPTMLHRFVVKSNTSIDNWNEITTLQVFLQTPSIPLQPWPQKSIPLDQAINSINSSRSQTSEKPKKKSYRS